MMFIYFFPQVQVALLLLLQALYQVNCLYLFHWSFFRGGFLFFCLKHILLSSYLFVYFLTFSVRSMKFVVILKACACVGVSLCSVCVPGGFGVRAGSELSMGFMFSWGVLVATALVGGRSEV